MHGHKGAQCTTSNLAFEIHKPFFTSNISDKQDFIGCSCDKTKMKPNKDSFLLWRMPLMNETGPRFGDWFVRHTLVPEQTRKYRFLVFIFVLVLRRTWISYYYSDCLKNWNGGSLFFTQQTRNVRWTASLLFLFLSCQSFHSLKKSREVEMYFLWSRKMKSLSKNQDF